VTGGGGRRKKRRASCSRMRRLSGVPREQASLSGPGQREGGKEGGLSERRTEGRKASRGREGGREGGKEGIPNVPMYRSARRWQKVKTPSLPLEAKGAKPSSTVVENSPKRDMRKRCRAGEPGGGREGGKEGCVSVMMCCMGKKVEKYNPSFPSSLSPPLPLV